MSRPGGDIASPPGGSGRGSSSNWGSNLGKNPGRAACQQSVQNTEGNKCRALDHPQRSVLRSREFSSSASSSRSSVVGLSKGYSTMSPSPLMSTPEEVPAIASAEDATDDDACADAAATERSEGSAVFCRWTLSIGCHGEEHRGHSQPYSCPCCRLRAYHPPMVSVARSSVPHVAHVFSSDSVAVRSSSLLAALEVDRDREAVV